MSGDLPGTCGSPEMRRTIRFLQAGREPEPLLAFEHPHIDPGKDWGSPEVTGDPESALLIVGADADSLRHAPVSLIVGLRERATWLPQSSLAVWVPPRQSVGIALYRTSAGDLLRGDALEQYDPGYVTLWGFRGSPGPGPMEPGEEAPITRAERDPLLPWGWLPAADDGGAVHLARPADDFDSGMVLRSLCITGGELKLMYGEVTCLACAKVVRRNARHAALARDLIAKRGAP